MLKHSKIWLLIGLMGVTGCSSEDQEEPMAERGVPVTLTSYVADYHGADRGGRANEARGITRTWTPPTGYSTLAELADKSISIFLTKGTLEDGLGEEFFYKRGEQWRVSTNLTSGDTYYIYGYVPYDVSIRPSIAKLDGETDYKNGAVLTLENLPAVTTNDICVIVGAKNGTSADNDNGLTTGQFDYVAGAVETPGSNNVFLLFDHLYSSISVQFMVEENYNRLRTIKLKKLELQARVLNETTGEKTPLKRKTKAVITLRKTTDGSSPLMYNGTEQITFTPDNTSANADEPLYTSADGYVLSTSLSDFNGCFMSQGVSDFTIRSTYDVYDKQGNKIREGCKAENKLDIHELYNTISTASRGFKYIVRLIVNPTYLYVLSEPDLDNPTIIVNE